MKIYTGLLACLLLALTQYTAAMDKNVRRTAERILSKERISSTSKQQKSLLNLFLNKICTMQKHFLMILVL